MKLKPLFLCFLLMSTVLFSACTQQQITDTTGQVIASGKKMLDDTKNFVSNESARDETKISMASGIAEFATNSNIKKIEKIETYQQYIAMADNLNFVIDVINKKTDANIKQISKGVEDWNKFNMEATRYAPLFENYNSLVDSCYAFDKNNEKSANLVLIKSSSFTAEALLILGTAFYKTAFFATGKIAEATGITKLASVCDSCVSSAMSAGHWTIRNGMIEKTTEFAENITLANT